MDAGPEITGTFEVFEQSKGSNLTRRRVYGAWRFSLIGLVVAFFVLFGLAFWVTSEVGPKTGGGEVVVLVTALVCAAVAFAGLQRLVNWIGYRRWYARGVPRHVTFTYTVAAEGLVMSSELGRSVVFWSALNELAVDRHHWAIIGPGVSYFVPRRFFANDSEERAFASAVLDHVSSAAQARSKSAYKVLASLTAS
ncbi:MAG: YcxB family protein [Reyranella sp.]|nr:YcxB family protein [Reyranella sp.]